jgi:hypothetical protein
VKEKKDNESRQEKKKNDCLLVNGDSGMESNEMVAGDGRSGVITPLATQIDMVSSFSFRATKPAARRSQSVVVVVIVIVIQWSFRIDTKECMHNNNKRTYIIYRTHKFSLEDKESVYLCSPSSVGEIDSDMACCFSLLIALERRTVRSCSATVCRVSSSMHN